MARIADCNSHLACEYIQGTYTPQKVHPQTYLAFTGTAGESYSKPFRSLLLCSCDVFRALIISPCLLIYGPFCLKEKERKKEKGGGGGGREKERKTFGSRQNMGVSAAILCLSLCVFDVIMSSCVAQVYIYFVMSELCSSLMKS